MSEKANLPEVPWRNDIPRMDDDLLKARLMDLSPQLQIDILTSLDSDARLRLIRNSNAGREIVQGLPAEEVFLTVKGAEETDALPVINYTSPDQLGFILDMELWVGDRLDTAAARLWLMRILACGEEKVIELFDQADRELLIMMMSTLVTLVPNEEGVTVPQGLSSIMPDEFFTILSNVPEDTESIRLLLRIIRQWNRDRFYELLFDIHGRSGAEVEEEALRWRNSRLETRGLLEFDEAVEIYAYIGEDEARKLAEGPVSTDRERAEVQGNKESPAYPVALAEPGTLFYSTLVSIDDLEIRNRLRSEIAFSANRLLVADSERIGDITAMKTSLARLFALSNVGLLFLSGGDKRMAERIVRSLPVKDLFQIGFSRAADLGSLARKIASTWWPEWRKQGFPLLDFPADEILSGVLKRIPQLYVRPEGGTPAFRDFATFEEIQTTRRGLEEIAVIAEVLFEHLGLPRPHEAELQPGSVFRSGLEEITMAALLLTGFVRFATQGGFEIVPLDPGDIQQMFEVMREPLEDGGMRIRPGVTAAFMSWLEETVGFTGRKLEIMRGYLESAVAELESEIRGFSSAAEFDPRYVRSVIVAGRADGQRNRDKSGS